MTSVFMPRLVASFRKRHSLVAFDICVADHNQALNFHRMLDCDVAQVFNLSRCGYRTRRGFEQRLWIIMHRSHPLEKESVPLNLRGCADYPPVMRNRKTSGRQLFDRFLARRSLRLQPVVECNSFEFLLGYLHHEQALSFQIQIGAARDDGPIVSRAIGDCWFPKREQALATLRGHQLPVVYSFIEYLRHGLEATSVDHDTPE